MKLQYKCLLMLLLFFGIIIFNNNSVFAGSWLGTEGIKPNEIPTNLPAYEQIVNIFNSYDPERKHEILIFRIDGDDDIYVIHYEDKVFLPSAFYIYPSEDSLKTSIFFVNTRNNTTQYNSTYYLANISKNSDGNYELVSDEYIRGFEIEGDPTFDIIFSTVDVYKGDPDNFVWGEGVYYYSDLNPNKPEPSVDKLNLYELNLTDLDYNNTVHQFNIATYTNSPCYDEIMEYYNKNYQYSIYVTDYRRTLTYGEPDNDDSFQYGSYNLSGYIDFIAHDKGVFYYDKSATQIETGIYQTEMTIKPTTEYTKRFYFNAVYSEDSNDPNMIVFEDNGNLGQTYNLNNIYAHFIGSSQTIYYCAENGTSNVATKGIVTRIDTVYYKGYLNPWGNIDKDKVRDISIVPFYVYNFKFAGGTTNLLFLNSPTYNDDISNIYNDLNEIHNNNEIVPDSSEGGSYVQGIDSTSSTYEPGKVTNDTTDEQDKEHEGGIRVPGVNTEDRSNWTILDYIKNIFTTLLNLPKTIIQGISSLFGNDDGSSTASSITETTDTITNKFSFKDNMINNANEIKDFIVNTQATHKYYLNINHKYLSGNICIIDLSWYEPYKPTVDAFICAFAYLAFAWHMFKIMPNLISGASAGSYVSDISTYMHTGTGRSSNIHKGGF